MIKSLTKWIAFAAPVEYDVLLLNVNVRNACNEIARVWRVAAAATDIATLAQFTRIWSSESSCNLTDCLNACVRSLTNDVVGIACDSDWDVDLLNFDRYNYYIEACHFDFSTYRTASEIHRLIETFDAMAFNRHCTSVFGTEHRFQPIFIGLATYTSSSS